MSDTYILYSTVAFDETREHEAKGLKHAQNPVKAIVDKYIDEYVNAFLNTNGGVIYFGVENDGQVSGIQLDRKQRDDLRTRIDQIIKEFTPSVDPDLYKIQFIPVVGAGTSVDQYVIELHVSKGRESLYWTGSQKAWVRGEGGNLPMPADMLERRLIAKYPAVKPTLHQLPSDLPDFVGRVDEISSVEQSIRKAGIAIVAGMPGIGKSALAIHVAYRLIGQFPDAQLYLNLRGSTDSTLTTTDALILLLRAINPAEKLPNTFQELVNLYRSSLHGKRMLLLLDDVADVEQIRELVANEATSATIVVSRRSFVLPGSNSLHLQALTPDESESLLLSICPRLRASTQLNVPKLNKADGQGLSAEIARLCGNLPLALRLAGSQLAEQIDVAPQEYIVQLADAQTRLKFVDASLSLSYESLDADLQTRWSMLSAFAGPFDRRAAAAIWQMNIDVAQSSLSTLTAYSLVDWQFGTGRYQLHALARMFANSRLREDTRQDVRIRFARHYLDVLREAVSLYAQGEQVSRSGLELFDLEWENIKLGQEWSAEDDEHDDDTMSDLCIAYANVGSSILGMRQNPEIKIKWLEAGLSCARKIHDRAAEKDFTDDLGKVYNQLGKADQAAKYHGQCWAVARNLQDRSRERTALCGIGRAYFSLGKFTQGAKSYERAIEVARESQDQLGEARALWGLGQEYANSGRTTESLGCYQQALQLVEKTKDTHLEAHILESMAWQRLAAKNKNEAVELFRQSLTLFQLGKPSSCETSAIRSIGRAYFRMGKKWKAIEFFQQALTMSAEVGDMLEERLIYNDLGGIYQAEHDYKRAYESFDQAARIAQRMQDRQAECAMQFAMGNLLGVGSNYSDALVTFEKALDLCAYFENSKVEAHIRERIGLVYLGLNEPHQAVSFLDNSARVLIRIEAQGCASHVMSNLAGAYIRCGDKKKASSCVYESMRLRFASARPGMKANDYDSVMEGIDLPWSLFAKIQLWVVPIPKRFIPNERLKRYTRNLLPRMIDYLTDSDKG